MPRPVRFRTFERLAARQLLASDLLIGSIPLEPEELVARDREKYAEFAARGDANRFAPLGDTFRLHSRPSATKTVYLDFDGNITIGTAWNRLYNRSVIDSPAYDPERNGPAFSNTELARIQEIWQRVASEFAPFDVNVTTEDPGIQNLANTGGNDDRWGMRVIMTVDNFANSGAGGFAFIDSFNWGLDASNATDTPCFVFNESDIGVSAAASHEVGHSLGLSHDGTTASHPTQPSQAYYFGHGTGETSWGPIMGAGYYTNVTTWDIGEYFGTNNNIAGSNYGRGPDDIQVITTLNGFGTISDQIGDDISSATTIEYLGTSLSNPDAIDVYMFNTIETKNDLDFIRFETGLGLVNLTIDPYITEAYIADSSGGYTRTVAGSFFGTFWSDNQGANLDVEAKIFDEVGNLVATSNPNGLAAQFTNLNLTAGTYYLSIDGVGFGTPQSNPPVGYTDYGSIGQYQITGTVPSLGVKVDLGAGGAAYTENELPIPVSPAGTFTDSPFVNYDRLNLNASIVANGEAADRLSIISKGTGPAEISTSGNRVMYEGTTIGTYTSNAVSLAVDLNGNANRQAVEALVRSIAYASVSDGPSTAPRVVQFAFGTGITATRNVFITPVNDSPSMSDVALASFMEDVQQPVGQPIDLVIANGFSDPDPAATLKGVAIVGNNASAATEGVWYFSSDQGTTWIEIGSVDDAGTSLLISASDWIGFLPVADYFGTPTPLDVRPLDNTFAGSFSNSISGVRRFLDNATRNLVNGPVSTTIGQLAASIININDPPRATSATVQIDAVQDQLVDFKFNVAYPPSLFTDVDSSNLLWTLKPVTLPAVPTWIQFDPDLHQLRGTPENSDVGVLEFQLTASDDLGLSVTIPLTISVANVNDPPQVLDLDGQSVVENDIAARIGRVIVNDPDLQDTVTYTVSDSRFMVIGGALFLRSSTFVDYELEREIPISITVTDNGQPQLSTSKSFTLKVQDQNEFFPALTPQSFVIPLQRTAETVLGIVQAPDQDFGQTVRYRIASDPARIFQIDAITGALKLAPGATVSQKNYELFITAFDNGTPSNSRVVQFTVRAEVPNLFAPQFVSGTALTIAENSPPGTVVGRVVGQDGDVDSTLTYTMNSSRFTINSSTGQISLALNGSLDFESQNRYVESVTITDNGTPQRSTTQPVTISIGNVNEPPTAIALTNRKVITQQKGIEFPGIVVTDEDPAFSYTFTTTDPRFEIRNGKLALKPSVFFAQSLAGTQSFVDVTVTDANDPTSSAVLPLVFEIVSNALPWQNPVQRFDVNSDGTVSPLDASLIVAALNSQRSGPLTVPRELNQINLSYFDTSGDNSLTPLDALLVITELASGRNRGSGEGPVAADGGRLASSHATSSSVASSLDSQVWYEAFSSLESERRLRLQKKP